MNEGRTIQFIKVAKGPEDKVSSLWESVKKHLKNPNKSGIVGAAGLGSLMAAAGAIHNYGKPKKKRSIFTNPALLGAIGALGGYAGGQYLDSLAPDRKAGKYLGVVPEGAPTDAALASAPAAVDALATQANREALKVEVQRKSNLEKRIKDINTQISATRGKAAKKALTAAKLDPLLKEQKVIDARLRAVEDGVPPLNSETDVFAANKASKIPGCGNIKTLFKGLSRRKLTAAEKAEYERLLKMSGKTKHLKGLWSLPLMVLLGESANGFLDDDD